MIMKWLDALANWWNEFKFRRICKKFGVKLVKDEEVK